ncbi:TPA: 30S ribosome-binding factor RbfA [Candidatus Berkelbacteria bacterium]|uniref:Ribosome-binding factor A n=1 Tax=Berkelbacteria bacterium GW2011_GWE1_39_12 TaxID=1618337 RepID=A0A0G4B704_9BACT|nr:MAG: ribosome-binding factor A, ribosome-binding factor A [Berkelbacteria bacterium GW2011_GWE1_39_12]HBO60167.1 30S ribosome-binding factor RbfA [Candidatus Berkelbacteria bacterium]
MSTRRVEKVSALLKRELSELIRNDLSEQFGLITIMDIDITPDFKDAKVYISIFNTEEEDKILKTLEGKTRAYQKVLGDKLRMKFTPHLTFKTDNYQEKVDRVDELLKEIDHGS